MKINDEILELVENKIKSNMIEPELYSNFKVYRGLRDNNGKGVLTGLTKISSVKAKELINDEEKPCKGELRYRGYDINELVDYFDSNDIFGFEQIAYLLMFGDMPQKKEFSIFNAMLKHYNELPSTFIRDFIFKAPSTNIMNYLSRSILLLYAFDKKPDDTSSSNVIKQCIKLIARMPQIAVYGYHTYRYYITGHGSLTILEPKDNLSIAENILYMLRPNGAFTHLEAKILDLALILHAEHGGGNNSTFATRVVSSSGTDTYSAIAAALGSLKGPKHGGANIKVCEMMQDLMQNIKDFEDETEIENYLNKVLHKEAFDHTGLIYGLGHAVYSLSDPRAEILKKHVGELAKEKGKEKELALYNKVEKIGIRLICEQRKIFKGVCANIDFYSGFIYQMLDLPIEMYTPIFAISRIAGWSAHRIEELTNSSRIIRPAYKNVQDSRNLKENENDK